MTLFEKTVRRESNTNKYDSLQEAYMKVLNEDKKEYTDDDWVLVANRKALKFYKNPKNDKAPRKAFNDMNNSSKDYEVVRISKAKKMGIKGV